MPDRIPPSRRNRIIELYLQGLGKNELARQAGEAATTVKREIKRFETTTEDFGIHAAAEKYNVTTLLEELHSIAEFKRKNKLENEELAAGANLAALFSEHGVNQQGTGEFIQQVLGRAKQKKLTPEMLVRECAQLNTLEKKHGPFAKIQTEWEELATLLSNQIKEENRLKTESHRLNREVEALQKKQAETLQLSQATEENLKAYRETKATLLTHGLDLKNLDDATRILKALKAQGFEAQRLIAKLKSVETLEEHETQLQRTIDQQREVLQNINEELKLKQNQLSERKHILSEAQKIEETGLTIRDIQSIKETVTRIAANKGKTPREAIRQFREDLRRNYDPLMGLGPEVEALRKEKSRLNRELKELTRKLKNEEKSHTEQIRLLNQQYASKKTQIDAYTKLREQGVDDEALKRWSSIMVKTKLPPKVIEAELRKQATDARTQSEVEKEITLLTGQRNKLARQIHALDSKKQQTEAALSTIEKECVRRIEQTGSAAQTQLQQAAIDLAKNLRTATNETITTLDKSTDGAVKSISQTASASGSQIAASANTLSNAVDKATTRTTDTLTSLQRNLDQYLEKIKTDLAESMKNADDLARKALEAGRELSKHEAAHLLIKIYAGEPVPTSEILAFYLDILQRLPPFLAENKPQRAPDIPNTIITLIQGLRAELGVGTGQGRLVPKG